MYLCDDHADFMRMQVEFSDDLSEVEYRAFNSRGAILGLAEYARGDGCSVCWQ